MQIIPIQDVFSQTFVVNLDGQICQINIYQKQYTDSVAQTSADGLIVSLFLDLYVNNTLIIGGVICENLNRIVRSIYLGFQGDLCFWDTQGSSDPSSPGLGTRFLLCYLEVTDLNGMG